VPNFTFDPRASRYRAADGRFGRERTLRTWLDAAIDQSATRTVALTQQLQQGTVTLAEWQAEMMQTIKASHVAAASAAHGGRQMMAPADWGWTGAKVKEQYQFLRNWANEIASGVAPLDGRLVARARLYADAPVATYEGMKARDARTSGLSLEEKNVLSAADHCGECPGLTARGWVPLGTLPAIGTRECRVRDRCRIIRRTVEAA
jgi:hypothetical protein